MLVVQIAILLDCFREEMHKESCQRVANGNGISDVKYLEYQNNVFWSVETLELVELILKPPQGGPPILPEDSDAVSLFYKYSLSSFYFLFTFLLYFNCSFTAAKFCTTAL